MTHVSINMPAIEHFFEQRAFASGAIPGLGGSADRMATRMLAAAKKNASGGVVKERTGTLKESLRKIVRADVRTGALEVGVGSVVEYSKYLEDGTSRHPIDPSTSGVTGLKSNGPLSRGYNPDPLWYWVPKVKDHPGNTPKFFIRDAVRSVAHRGL